MFLAFDRVHRKLPEVLVGAGEDAEGFLVLVAGLAELLQDGVGATGGAGAGEREGLELQETQVIRELVDAFVRDVEGDKTFTLFQSDVGRAAVDFNILRPDDRDALRPEGAQLRRGDLGVLDVTQDGLGLLVPFLLVEEQGVADRGVLVVA